MDDKLRTRVENLKDLVLYRHGSTGVVEVLRRAAGVLGLIPVFPVRNIHTFGSADGDEVFRDCVLMNKWVSDVRGYRNKKANLCVRGSTVADVARKIMGDAPIAFIETVGGIKIAEDEPLVIGKNDVSG